MCEVTSLRDAVNAGLGKVLDGQFIVKIENRLKDLEREGETREKEISDLRIKLRQKEMQMEIVMMDLQR